MGTMSKNPSSPALAADLEPDPAPRRDERRSHDRFDVEWAVDCVAEDTFLYASITNISAMGIFVKTMDPARDRDASRPRRSLRRATSPSSSRARSRGSTRCARTATTPTPAWASAS